MISIITGDIINSRDSAASEWLSILKNEFKNHGNSPKTWEIYRGDSFQLETNIKEALEIAFLIKSAIKQNSNLDVRMAIGIGNKSHNAGSITEANGSAFVNSGNGFEALKRNTLAIKTNNKDFNTLLNIMIDLAVLKADNWTPIEAETFYTALKNPDKNQKQLAKLLNKTQSNISAGLKRSGYDEITKLLDYYKQNIVTL